jgi:hypothetical protein
MNAKNFEQAFDDGVDITASLDLPKAKRVLQEQMTTNVQSDDAPLNLSPAPTTPPTPNIGMEYSVAVRLELARS